MEYISLQQLQHALTHFGELVKQHPEYLPTYYHYGRLLKNTEQVQAAEAIWRLGMEVAQRQRDFKTLAEIKGELAVLLNIDEDDL
jgi:tetratricopeptide (TPR) repeat protein